MNSTSRPPSFSAIPSPCTGVCRLDVGRRYCQGCGRTPAEISAWPGASDQARLTILQALRERQAQ